LFILVKVKFLRLMSVWRQGGLFIHVRPIYACNTQTDSRKLPTFEDDSSLMVCLF